MNPQLYKLLLLAIGSLLIIAFSKIGVSQFISQEQSRCSYLEKDKPAVFISYEGVEDAKPNLKGKNKAEVILRLHNNSTCTIVVETDEIEDEQEQDRLFKKEITHYSDRTETRLIPDPPEGARLPILYDIQEDRERALKPANYWDGRDIVFTYDVPSGRSVTFAVDAEHFKRKYNISIRFIYRWKENAGLRTLGTIKHRVYYDYDLPRGFHKD